MDMKNNIIADQYGKAGNKHRRLNDCSMPFQPSSVNQRIVTLSFTDIDANKLL